MAITIVEQSGGQYHVLVIIADGQVRGLLPLLWNKGCDRLTCIHISEIFSSYVFPVVTRLGNLLLVLLIISCLR